MRFEAQRAHSAPLNNEVDQILVWPSTTLTTVFIRAALNCTRVNKIDVNVVRFVRLIELSSCLG